MPKRVPHADVHVISINKKGLAMVVAHVPRDGRLVSETLHGVTGEKLAELVNVAVRKEQQDADIAGRLPTIDRGSTVAAGAKPQYA